MKKFFEVKEPKTKRRKMNFLWRYRADYLFMLPYLVIFFLFQVMPVLVSIVLGFTNF